VIIAVIPAKDDSLRLANKNMQILAGRPMIYYSIESAKKSKLINKIYVSTNSDEIAKFAEEQGVDVIRRGPELGGETPLIEVYYHALKKINNPKIKMLVGIQPDHPDRNLDIDTAITYLTKKNRDELITVDKDGFTNGSLFIIKSEVLLSRIFLKVAVMMDDCTNIHNSNDLKKAEVNLRRRVK